MLLLFLQIIFNGVIAESVIVLPANFTIISSPTILKTLESLLKEKMFKQLHIMLCILYRASL